MKKQLILSSCLLLLTTPPLLASGQMVEDEKQRKIAKAFEDAQKPWEDKLHQLLSTPNPNPDDIYALPEVFLVRYITEISLRQTSAPQASPPAQNAVNSAEEQRLRELKEKHTREHTEKVNDFLAQGEYASLQEIASLPADYQKMYYRKSKELQRAQAFQPQQSAARFSSRSIPTNSGEGSPLSNSAALRAEEELARKYSRQVEELVAQGDQVDGDKLASLPESYLEMYFQYRAQPSQPPSLTRQPEKKDKRIDRDASFDMTHLESEFQRAQLRAQQDEEFKQAFQADQHKEALQQKIDQRQEEIAQVVQRYESLSQLFATHATTITRIERLKKLSPADSEKEIIALNKKLPGGLTYQELSAQYDALATKIEEQKDALEEDRRQLAVLRGQKGEKK